MFSHPPERRLGPGGGRLTVTASSESLPAALQRDRPTRASAADAPALAHGWSAQT
ncbi:MAG: hypothetical protein ACKODX_03155 [Gemmata sp.]